MKGFSGYTKKYGLDRTVSIQCGQKPLNTWTLFREQGERVMFGQSSRFPLASISTWAMVVVVRAGNGVSPGTAYGFALCSCVLKFQSIHPRFYTSCHLSEMMTWQYKQYLVLLPSYLLRVRLGFCLAAEGAIPVLHCAPVLLSSKYKPAFLSKCHLPLHCL